MPYRQEPLVQVHSSTLVGIEVGRIDDVVTLLLEEANHVELPIEEQTRAIRIVVRAVERNLYRRGLSRAVRAIERLTAPGVIGLVGCYSALQDQIGFAAIVANDEDYVSLLQGGESGEFDQVYSAYPVG